MDIDALDTAIKTVEKSIANQLTTELQQTFDANRATEAQPYAFEDADIDERSLKNRALYYLSRADNKSAILQTAKETFAGANNHTDERAALVALVEHGDPASRKEALDSFYDKWKNDDLVLNKWFSLQATADSPDVLDTVKSLTKHPDYNLNPNRVRSVVGAFASANPVHFHREDGKGYEFLADQVIELDKSNPQLAARFIGPLNEWEKYDDARQQKMVGELVRILKSPKLSHNTLERTVRGVKAAIEKGITEEGKDIIEAFEKEQESASKDNGPAGVAPKALTAEEREIREALLEADGDFLVSIPQKWVPELQNREAGSQKAVGR